MAQLVISAAGAAVGFAVGGPVGAQVGWLAGSLLGATVFAPEQEVPKVGDLKAPAVEYGSQLVRMYGSNRTAGVLAWYSTKRVVAGNDGGKGTPDAATPDTAEIDVLYILAVDSPIIAITRIWINKELKWTAHSDSDSDSVSTSNSTDAWAAVHFLDGNAAQLPHPVIEAEEGVGNAPAYRHRQCVLIDSLQLGNSGQMPLVEFECITDGELTPPKTRLQSYFDDNDSEDISYYENGAGTLSGAALSGEALVVNHDTLGAQTLTYDSDAIVGDGVSPVTVEAIVSWSSTPNVHYMRVLRYISNTALVSSTSYSFGFSTEAGLIVYDDAEVGTEYTSVAAPSAPTHLALVAGATSLRAYVNGIKVYERPGDWRPEAGAVGRVVLGDPNGYADETPTAYSISEFAVRFEEQYDDDFTPPSRIKAPDFPTYQPGTRDLRYIVEAEWVRCSDVAEIDASELDGIPVRGFQTGGSVRGAYEALAPIFHFGAVCSDKLYFRLQGGASVATIPFGDLAAGEGQAGDEPFAPERANDEEIAERVVLTYPNQLDNYANGTETGNRGSESRIVVAKQSNVVMHPSEAKACAETFAAVLGISAITAQISLSDYYAELEPTDPITVPDQDGTLYRMRVVRETLGRGVRTMELVRDDVSVLTAPGVTSEDYTPSLSVAGPADTDLLLLDVPLLRDVDNDAGFYAAAKGSNRGSVVYSSLDDVTFAEEVTIPVEAVFGDCLTTLPDWTGRRVFDETSLLTVNVGDGTLSSSTRAAMLADQSVNACAVGLDGRWELCQFSTASMVSAGIYTVSGWLRGSRGTEWASVDHVAAEKFVLLSADTARRVEKQAGEIGADEFYKGVSVGRLISSADSQEFSNDAVGLKPFAPVHVRARVDTGRNIVLTWMRRTRLSTNFTGPTGSVVPLGEASEAYSVDVVVDDEVVRTISATSETCTYTASQQSADGVGTSTDIRFDVHQVSAVVGRGYAGSLETNGAVTSQPQITELTVGGSFATGAALYATLGGVTYGHTSAGGDTDLAGIATALAAVIDAASAYSASAVGAVISVTGPVSVPFPVVVGVGAGDNTTTLALTQTASAAVAGVSNELAFRWLNLEDPAGDEAYPLGMTMYALVQRVSPALYLTYSYVTTPSGRTNYEVLPIAAAAILSAFNSSGDREAYGLNMTLSDSGTSTLSLFTPASEPYNWTVQALASVAEVTGLVGNTGRGVTPAALRPQIVTLTLAGTPATGRVYRATLGGVNYDYTAGGGDTTMALVATGLAAVIDAAASYSASAVGAVITITHASNNVPFTYSASVIASAVTLTAATTQDAA